MTIHMDAQLKQRAEFTHKHNLKNGRHGWLRLTPAYSVKVVEDIIQRYDKSKVVLDPFCGTGTTALSAVNHGHPAITTDINPFLIWLAKTKTQKYTEATLKQVEKAGRNILDVVRNRSVVPAEAPPIHNIERWWSPKSLEFLLYLKSALDEVAGGEGGVRDLLKVIFCRTMIQSSNAAFNHQSMSFKNPNMMDLLFEEKEEEQFVKDILLVLSGASGNPRGNARIVQHDARELEKMTSERADIVITSPPYANRMSYIRELRPYMYWLGYLKEAREAGDLDWEAIGGTWGVATSRLMDWKAEPEGWEPLELKKVTQQIRSEANKNGELLSNYVSKYFHDMARHFKTLGRMMNAGGHVHYIVGNSTFYGTLVETEKFYASALSYYGFQNVDICPIRKRNSKKELIEFAVTATWPG